MGKKISVNKVAQALDVSIVIIGNWYKWYNDPDIDKPKDTPFLPAYEQHSIRGRRLWDVDDIPALIKFKEWIPKGKAGVMGKVSARSWSKKYYQKKEVIKE